MKRVTGVCPPVPPNEEDLGELRKLQRGGQDHGTKWVLTTRKGHTDANTWSIRSHGGTKEARYDEVNPGKPVRRPPFRTRNKATGAPELVYGGDRKSKKLRAGDEPLTGV